MKYIAFIRSLLLIFLTAFPVFGYAAPHDGSPAIKPNPKECEGEMADGEDFDAELNTEYTSAPIYREILEAHRLKQKPTIVELLDSEPATLAAQNPEFVLALSKPMLHIALHAEMLRLTNVSLQHVPSDLRLKTLKLKLLYKLGLFAQVLSFADTNPAIVGISARKRILSSYIELGMKDKAREYALNLLADPELPQSRVKEKVLRLMQELFVGRNQANFQLALARFGYQHTKRTAYWGIRLAHVLSRSGQNQEAAAIIDQLIFLYPIHHEWWSQPNDHDRQQNVIIMMENGRFDEALDFADHIQSHTDRALFQAQIFNRMGDHERALEFTLGSNLFPALWERARALHKLDREVEAYRILNDLLYRIDGSMGARDHIYRTVAFMLNLEKLDGSIVRSRFLDSVLNRFSNSEIDRVRAEQSKLD